MKLTGGSIKIYNGKKPVSEAITIAIIVSTVIAIVSRNLASANNKNASINRL